MTNRSFFFGVLALLAMAALLIWIGRSTDIDLILADAMFDTTTNTFPWRDRWFSAQFMHHFMKALFLGIALVPIAALAFDGLLRKTLSAGFDALFKRRLLVLAASATLIALVISLSKSMSVHHCPWSLTRYGGYAPYLRIFDRLPAGVSSGHCFPAGHASSALWLAAACVFWLPSRPGKALAVFGIGLLPGMALGWVQQMRGAHFLTHTLWSAWIAALVILILARLLLTEQRCSEHPPGSTWNSRSLCHRAMAAFTRPA